MIRGVKAPGDPVSPAILWAYHQAAQLASWSIVRGTVKGQWAFSATVETADDFKLRQQPLYFAAPRQKGGFWMWPLKSAVQIKGKLISATLGQPEY